jgi:hypothetical protein
MTRDEIIEIAQEVGFEVNSDGRLMLYGYDPILVRPNHVMSLADGIKLMIEVAVKREREECAVTVFHTCLSRDDGIKASNAIRARGSNE